MSDILERLRAFEDHPYLVRDLRAGLAKDAADELDRLRAEKTELVEALDLLIEKYEAVVEDDDEPRSLKDDALTRARKALSRARETGGEDG